MEGEDEHVTVDFYDDDRTARPFRSLLATWNHRSATWAITAPSPGEDFLPGSHHQLVLVPRGIWTRRPAGICRGLAGLSTVESEDLADAAVRLGYIAGLGGGGYPLDFQRRWLPVNRGNNDWLSWRTVVKAATPHPVLIQMIGSYLVSWPNDQEWVAVGLDEASQVSYEARLRLGPEAAEAFGEELVGVPYRIGLHDMMETARRARMRAWPFLDQAHPLRLLMEALHRVGPDMQLYRCYWKQVVPADITSVAEHNSHGIDGECIVYYAHFFQLNIDCGLNLDSMVARGLLPGWQRLVDALNRRRGSARDQRGLFSFKRSRDEDDDAEEGAESQSSGAAGGQSSSGARVLPDN